MKNLILTLLLALACSFATAQVIEQTYHFNRPVVQTIDGYEMLNFEGCRLTGTVGTPILPWQNVSLMLPQGQEARSISVEFYDFEELDGTFNLYPVQPDRPVSADGPFEFIKDEVAYRSSKIFPEATHTQVNTQYLNGVGFAFSGFTPMRYVASTGKVTYAHVVKVKVETAPSRTDNHRKTWLRPNNIRSIEKIAQNESLLSTYQGRDKVLPQYEVLVITPLNFVNFFDEYINLYTQRGTRVRVVSTEDIYNAIDGRDNQERIRNFIIQEYEENGISMVVLGGDINLVPYRSLWCHAQEGYDDNVPSDLYYAGLDGTWNDNGNNLWGEIGEDDLLPEIGISRLPFNNSTELQRLIDKTLSYMNEPVLGEFTQTTFAGEHLGNGYYASSDLERLVGEVTYNGYTTYGYDENIYEINRVYATPTHEWDRDELRDAIRQGTQYVNHFGHANTDYVAGWSNWDINTNLFQGANGVDHNFTLFQSQGCICGDFSDDCILERMVLNPTGIIAATGNSRYGWYSTAGDASSAHLNRELIDAYCHERIPELSLAFKESKIQAAPFVTMYGEMGTLRWTMYALNVIGDGTLNVWFGKPFTPQVECPSQIQLGDNHFSVSVTDSENRGLLNFRCNLFKGDELIALATTDENGIAEMNFYPTNAGETLTLVVTGMNALPLTFNITLPNANCSHVIYDNYEIHDADGQIDFNESHSLDMTFRNVGSNTAHNVVATLTTETPQYIDITKNEVNIGDMAGYAYNTIADAFAFTVCDSIPNETEIVFNLECTDGIETWSSSFSMMVFAPDFQVTEIIMEETEGNGNGIADFGETLTLHLTVKNIGNSMAPASIFNVVCHIPDIIFDNDTYTLGDMETGDAQTLDFTFTTNPDMTTSAAYGIKLLTTTGSYTFTDNYFINVGCEAEDFETGDFSKYNWEHSSNQWTITSNNTYEGNYCARSPQISDNQSASLWIDYEVLYENEFSFQYKVSSEVSYDFLSFYIDDELIDRWSGSISWSKATFTLPQGQHCLKWEYAKDAGVSSGNDCAWLDFIVFPPEAVILGLGSTTETNNSAIYPNPSNGDIHIDLNEMSDIYVYNPLGQCCLTRSNVEGHLNLHLDQKGLYMVCISNKAGTKTHKLIVK